MGILPAPKLPRPALDLEKLKIDRASRNPRRRSTNPWPLRGAALGVLSAVGWLVWPSLRQMADRLRLPEVRTFVVTEAAPAAAAAVRGTAANGYVVAARRAALSSDVPGRIVELNVTEGSVVRRGDIVARLFADEYRAAWQRSEADLEVATAQVARADAARDAAGAELLRAEGAERSARAQVEQAAAALTFAELELQRYGELADTGIEGRRRQQQAESDRDAAAARLRAATADAEAGTATTAAARARVAVAERDIALAEAQAKVAVASRAQARATLDKTDVRAPFDGIVVLKDAEVGEVVSPNVQGGSNARGAVCTLVDFDSLEVQANVPETSLAAVQLGAPADVFLDAFPDDRLPGTVDRVWPTADRQKATVEVRVRLAERSDVLRPEMGVRVVFRRDDPAGGERAPAGPTVRSIVVPEEALVLVQGRTGAFVVERDVVRFAAVTAGERRGGRVAIDAGLSANQRIVLAPPTSLQDGDRVRLADR